MVVVLGEITHLSKLAIQEVRNEATEGRDRQLHQARYSYSAADVAVDGVFFIAQRPWRISAIRGVPVVAGTDVGAVTAEIRKLTGTQAPSAGVVIHSGSYDLKGTINTVQSLTPVTVEATRHLDVGDRLAFDLTGVSAAAAGHVTVGLIPVSDAVSVGGGGGGGGGGGDM